MIVNLNNAKYNNNNYYFYYYDSIIYLFIYFLYFEIVQNDHNEIILFLKSSNSKILTLIYQLLSTFSFSKRF